MDQSKILRKRSLSRWICRSHRANRHCDRATHSLPLLPHRNLASFSPSKSARINSDFQHSCGLAFRGGLPQSNSFFWAGIVGHKCKRPTQRGSVDETFEMVTPWRLADFDVAISQDYDFHAVITAGEFVGQNLAAEQAWLQSTRQGTSQSAQQQGTQTQTSVWAAGAGIFDAES